jgi:hypothetical protein
MPASAKAAQVEVTQKHLDFLRADPKLGTVITASRVDKPGQLTKPFVDGATYRQLSPAAKLHAEEHVKELSRGVYDRLNQAGAPDTPEFVVRLDRTDIDKLSFDNFRFEVDGTVKQWLDPISVIPKPHVVVAPLAANDLAVAGKASAPVLPGEQVTAVLAPGGKCGTCSSEKASSQPSPRPANAWGDKFESTLGYRFPTSHYVRTQEKGTKEAWDAFGARERLRTDTGAASLAPTAFGYPKNFPELQRISHARAVQTAEDWSAARGWSPTRQGSRQRFVGIGDTDNFKHMDAVEDAYGLDKSWNQTTIHGVEQPDGRGPAQKFSETIASSWGTDVSPAELAERMRAGGYVDGPVRLNACSSGQSARPEGVAQELADRLGWPVVAPSNYLVPKTGIIVDDAGDMAGRWRVFVPVAK